MAAEHAEIEQRGSLVVARMGEGDLTHIALQEAADECLQRLRYDNAQHFIFDLAGVNFVASACLGVLVSFMQEVEHVRGRIALINVSDNVQFLFKVTHLDSVFPIHDDEREAVESF